MSARGSDPLPYEDAANDPAPVRKPVRRIVEPVVHLDQETVFGNPAANVGRCESTRTPLLA
jgi:hypothetical protein